MALLRACSHNESSRRGAMASCRAETGRLVWGLSYPWFYLGQP
ncbi:hypothetical protein [Ralstonia phage RSK1]|uniref:Uncharacterized protein n=1 Tax=Ralstonia phage RSK1 TaxID=1417599 RepID=U6C6A7_9CAUD|nr:hypothetical protein X532_gp25 [Ralstonia phage RSK1]BAO04690.1 hypothetical protein [Ralstonia phage RSK1]